MHRNLPAVFLFALTVLAGMAWLDTPAQANSPSQAVCGKFAPYATIPDDKVEAFINEQVAAGRTNIESISMGAKNAFLLCAW